MQVRDRYQASHITEYDEILIYITKYYWYLLCISITYIRVYLLSHLLLSSSCSSRSSTALQVPSFPSFYFLVVAISVLVEAIVGHAFVIYVRTFHYRLRDKHARARFAVFFLFRSLCGGPMFLSPLSSTPLAISRSSLSSFLLRVLC